MVKLGKARRMLVHLHATWGGWVFMAGSLMVGWAATRNNAPLLFVIFGTMVALITFSAVHAKSMLEGIELQRELPQRVWQYETLYFGYVLKNIRHKPAMAISMREIDPAGVHDASALCVYLPPKGVFRSGSRLTAIHRGRTDLVAVRVTSSFPFGLVRLRKDFWQTNSMIVWPAKGKLKADLLRHGAAITSTARPSRMQSGQDEFFGLRDYRIGDNLRWIHWRRSANRHVPVVREMSHPVPDMLFVILDIQPTNGDEILINDQEKMLRFTATLLDDALGHGYQVGMAFAGVDRVEVIKPGYGVGVRARLLDALADLTEPENCTLFDVVKTLPMAPLRKSQTLLITQSVARLPSHPMGHLAGFCRHLNVISSEQIDQIFEDSPAVKNALGGRI